MTHFTSDHLDTLKGVWYRTPPEVRTLLTPINSEEQYQNALQAFELLLPDIEGETPPSDEALELFNTIGEHLRVYEQQKMQAPSVSGSELLRFLMQQHGLKQSDVPELGSQGVVSEILNGKRTLNLRQAKALGSRFKLEYTAFLR